MFGLFKRRKKREREAQARRDALRAKAGTTASESSLAPGETYRDGIAWDFADALIAVADPVGKQPAPRTLTASPDYAAVKPDHELPRRIELSGGGGGAPGESIIRSFEHSDGHRHVLQRHHGSGDNIVGSVHHASHHSSHDYSSSSDSGSYDSGSSSGSDSSW